MDIRKRCLKLLDNAKIRYLCNRNGQPQSNRICSINRLVVLAVNSLSIQTNVTRFVIQFARLTLTNSLSLAH